MDDPVEMVEIWRGPFRESVHRGWAVVARADGEMVHAWGDPETTVLPRSSVKMIQALPLVESGATLAPEQLALACASHQGAAMHTDRVRAWLAAMELDEDALRCGTQWPSDREAANALVRADAAPGQIHNNCSGKHAGFLDLSRRLGGGEDYVAPDHPVQRAVRDAFEEVTGRESPGFGIDGCAAPNFATTLGGLARAMARFAAAREETGDARERAAARLRTAMQTHPALVAGEGRACTDLMRATRDVVVKTGAEGVYTAILPARGLGVALKIADGATRAAETAIAALLARLGALDPGHPMIRPEIRNRRGMLTGETRPADALLAPL